jgi:hypothetical protein
MPSTATVERVNHGKSAGFSPGRFSFREIQISCVSYFTKDRYGLLHPADRRPPKEDPMMNQFQQSLLVAERAKKACSTMHLAFVQAAIGFVLVVAISAFELFPASHAIGQESLERKAAPATTNVSPKLVISPESLEPNLNWMPATGDSGAMIEPQETTGSLHRTSPRAR